MKRSEIIIVVCLLETKESMYTHKSLEVCSVLPSQSCIYYVPPTYAFCKMASLGSLLSQRI